MKKTTLSNSNLQQFCPVQTTLDVIGGKWKPIILFYLQAETLRFNELNRKIGKHLTQKMLTQQLRQMEKDRLIERKVYPEVPPRVEYSITEYGKTLKPILKLMYEWGAKHSKESAGAH